MEVFDLLMKFMLLSFIRANLKRKPTEHSLSGQHLKIGLAAVDFSPYYSVKTENGKPLMVDGFYADVVDYLSQHLDFDYSWEPIPVALGGIDDFIRREEQLLFNKSLDVVTDWSNQPFNTYDWTVVRSTLPIASQYISAFRLRVQKRPGVWQVFQPFSINLWIGVLVIVIVFGLALFVIEYLEGKPASTSLLCEAIHAVCTAVLQGDDREFSPAEWRTLPRRSLRLGLLFFVLIFASSYTANLAAVLSDSGMTVVGPNSVDELRYARACCTNASPEILTLFKAYTQEAIGPDATLTMDLGERVDWCIQKLRNGEVDVILDDEHVLGMYYPRHCHHVAKAEFRFLGGFVGLMLSAQNDKLLDIFNTAILDWQSKPHFEDFLRRSLHQGGICSDVPAYTSGIQVHNMLGLIIITSGSVCMSVLLATCSWQRRRPYSSIHL